MTLNSWLHNINQKSAQRLTNRATLTPLQLEATCFWGHDESVQNEVIIKTPSSQQDSKVLRCSVHHRCTSSVYTINSDTRLQAILAVPSGFKYCQASHHRLSPVKEGKSEYVPGVLSFKNSRISTPTTKGLQYRC